MSEDGADTEALEQRVKELEATVRGLTEELVDATERIRQLEEEHGLHEPAERAATERARAQEQREAAAEAAAEEAKAEAEPEESESEDDDGLGDDIIVA